MGPNPGPFRARPAAGTLSQHYNSVVLRSIVRYGDEVLRQRAEDVAEITAEVRSLIDDLVETMYAAPGVGLAAPQVGVPLRVFVADPSVGRNPDGLVVLVNPAVVKEEGVQNEEEGCLSVPGFAAKVRRPSRLVVSGLDREGEPIEVEGTGLLARALQHELDHLDGALFLDRLRGLKRELIVRRIHKLQRTGKW